LYRAKDMGRNKVVLHDPQWNNNNAEGSSGWREHSQIQRTIVVEPVQLICKLRAPEDH
jgi:hypothetical protein